MSMGGDGAKCQPLETCVEGSHKGPGRRCWWQGLGRLCFPASPAEGASGEAPSKAWEGRPWSFQGPSGQT